MVSSHTVQGVHVNQDPPRIGTFYEDLFFPAITELIKRKPFGITARGNGIFIDLGSPARAFDDHEMGYDAGYDSNELWDRYWDSAASAKGRLLNAEEVDISITGPPASADIYAGIGDALRAGLTEHDGEVFKKMEAIAKRLGDAPKAQDYMLILPQKQMGANIPHDEILSAVARHKLSIHGPKGEAKHVKDLARALSGMGLKRGMAWMDIGTGGNWFLPVMAAELGMHAVVTDVNESSHRSRTGLSSFRDAKGEKILATTVAEAAAKLNETAEGSITVIPPERADIFHKKFDEKAPDGYFDVISAMGVLNPTESQWRGNTEFVERMGRWTKNGGLWMISGDDEREIFGKWETEMKEASTFEAKPVDADAKALLPLSLGSPHFRLYRIEKNPQRMSL